MLDVDDILPSPLTPLVLPPPVTERKRRPCVRDANAGRLHDGPSLSTATVCGLNKSRPGETNSFTCHFFFLIRGVSGIYRERHKHSNTNETRKFVKKTSAAGLPVSSTVTAIVLPCITTITLGDQANYSTTAQLFLG